MLNKISRLGEYSLYATIKPKLFKLFLNMILAVIRIGMIVFNPSLISAAHLAVGLIRKNNKSYFLNKHRFVLRLLGCLVTGNIELV